MRISFALAQERTIRDISRRQQDMDRLGTCISSGKKLFDPSDNPDAWSEVMDLKQGLRELETFQNNIEFGLTWGKMTDLSLGHLSDLVDQAKQVAQATVSGSTPEEQAGHLQTLDHIVNEALGLANSRHENRYLFSGSADPAPGSNPPRDEPFTLDDATGQLQYFGSSGGDGDVRVRTGEGAKGSQIVNLDGEEAFFFSSGGTNTNVISELWGLREAVESNDETQIQAKLSTLEDSLRHVRTQRNVLAGRLTGLETQKQALGALKLGRETQLSNLEDADIAEMVTRLQQTRTAFEASLRVTSMVKDLNLMDFL
jgi:flagellar hook-associated protein 3 FlgL